MELDDLRQAWQALGRQLERHEATARGLYREQRLDAARRSLRPLLWGQALQLLLGVALVVLGVACWTRNLDMPALLAAGVLVHAFGLANAVLAALTIGLVATTDYGAPVLAIQKRMALLQRFHGLNAAVCAMPWWVMWIPVVVAFAGLGEVRPGAGTPAWIGISLGVGVAGLLGTWLYAWRRSRTPAGAAGVDRCDGGDGIRRGRRILDEIAEFERE